MKITKPKNVYFFGTCLIDLIYPQAGLSAIKLIQREGVRVIFPQGQTCCGQPAFNSGYRDEARGVAKKQLDLFSKSIPIIVPSASCADMIKHQYPELFAGTADEEKAVEVAARVWELTEFLTDILQIKLVDLGEPVEVVVHSSCSASHHMGVAGQIEKLLDQLQHVRLKTQAHKKECCGFGGTFAVKQPAISAAMVADKTAAIRETGASVLVSQDCGCLMNIGGAFEHQGNGPRAEHIATFLWERTHD